MERTVHRIVLSSAVCRQMRSLSHPPSHQQRLHLSSLNSVQVLWGDVSLHLLQIQVHDNCILTLPHDC